MLRKLGAFASWSVMTLALASVGCASSSDDDDDNDGTNAEVVAQFVGRWEPVSNTGTDSCTGEFDGGGAYVMELRKGTASDLEFIEYAGTDVTEVACSQRFDVDGEVAVLAGTQTCSYPFESVDEDGETVEHENPVTYKNVRLTLTDQDGLLELGNAEHADFETGVTCTSTYRITYVRE